MKGEEGLLDHQVNKKVYRRTSKKKNIIKEDKKGGVVEQNETKKEQPKRRKKEKRRTTKKQIAGQNIQSTEMDIWESVLDDLENSKKTKTKKMTIQRRQSRTTWKEAKNREVK